MTAPAKPAYPTADSQSAPSATICILAGDGTLVPVGAANPIPVSGAGLAVVGLGQAVMADSVPVTMASDQSTMPVIDASQQAQSSAVNLTSATRVKNAAGRVFRVSIIVAGSAPGTVNDCATTGAAAVSNQIATLPNTVGTLELDWPFATALVIVPGTGQTVAASYN